MPASYLTYNDYTPMPFGKYRGTPLINVPAPYLLWLYKRGCQHAGVKKYIVMNMEILLRENYKIQNFKN